jgi:hypothetical protein
VHRVRDEHRSRGAPHDLVRVVACVLAHAREQPVGELVARREAIRHRQHSCLAEEQAGGRVVRLGQLERAKCGAGEIDGHVRVAAAAQRIEREHDSRSAGVEVLERRLAVGEVTLVRMPEVVGIERFLRARNDRAHGVADAFGIPRLRRQLLEVVRVKERQRALARSQTCVQYGPSSR